MSKSPDAFRTISEVAEWLGVQAHVLRFWESKFTQVKPIKRAGGRRYYRPADMALLGGIKRLLHEDGLTIKGVQKILREQGMAHVAGLSQTLEEGEAIDATAGPPVPTPAKPEPAPTPEATVLPFEPAKPPTEEAQNRTQAEDAQNTTHQEDAQPATSAENTQEAATPEDTQDVASEEDAQDAMLAEDRRDPPGEEPQDAAPAEQAQDPAAEPQDVSPTGDHPDPPPEGEIQDAGEAEDLQPTSLAEDTRNAQLEEDTQQAEPEVDTTQHAAPAREAAATDDTQDAASEADTRDAAPTEDTQAAAPTEDTHEGAPVESDRTAAQDMSPLPPFLRDAADTGAPETATATAGPNTEQAEGESRDTRVTPPAPALDAPSVSPRPRDIGMPEVQAEHEIHAERSALSRAMQLRHLSADRAAEIAPLVDRLAALRDRMTAAGNGSKPRPGS